MSFYALIFGAGFAAGIINVMAGGGSLITLPALLFLGLPAPLANGTNRIAILIQNVAAVEGFRRKAIFDPHNGVRLALAALPGAIAGAFISVQVSDETFRAILAAVLAVAVIAMLVPPKKRDDGNARPVLPWWSYVAMLGVGFYGGFIQAGVGLLFLAVLYQALGMSLNWVNMYKVMAIGLYTIPAIAVFALTGNVEWITGLVLGAGNASGAVVSTHISVRGGERVVRFFIALAFLLMALRLVAIL